jgi:hypothetical protein
MVVERESGGPFKDLFDFADRVDARGLNKRQLENLVAAGAFESLVRSRAQVHAAIDQMMGEASATSRERESAQVNLFGEVETREPSLPIVDEWTVPDRLSHEFDAIGFYLSAHPLDEFATTLARLRVVPYAELANEKRHEQRAATLAGDRDLCRDNLRLDRGCQPFCLRKAKPEIAQTGLLIAFDACDLDLRRLPGLQLRHQFDPPHQFRHQFGVGVHAPGEGRMPLTSLVRPPDATQTTLIAATTSRRWRSRCGTGRNTRRGCVGGAA